VAAPAYLFHASKAEDGRFAVTGNVPTPAAAAYIADIARSDGSSGVTVVANAPENFIPDLLGGIDALARLSTGDLGFDGKTWSLKGHASTPELRTMILDRVAALPTGKAWTTDITGPSPLELCRQSLAQMGPDAIGFDAVMHKGSDAALDALAATLQACPRARVDIAAFTDSGGGANANMALTVARAEAVVDALVKRGVNAERLYAVGYGETLPLVPNTSRANRARNRRIEVTIEDAKQK
jgi:hypothetical protein